MKPIPDVNAFIAALVTDTKAAWESKSTTTFTALDERRHQLLAHHLGFTPRRPIEPIYVLGDSHTLFFAGEDGLNQVKHRRVGFWRTRYITRGLDLLPCFHTRHLGPATAWRAFERGSSTRSREKMDALLRHELHPGDRVLLSFGEIDCRCHIPKRVLAGESIETAVHETIIRFLALVKHFQTHDLRVAVWGPAIVTNSDRVVEGNPLPTVGPFALRSQVIAAYSSALHDACAALGVTSFCLAGTYHPWEQPAAAEFFSDGFHLSQQLMPTALRHLQEKQFLAATSVGT